MFMNQFLGILAIINHYKSWRLCVVMVYNGLMMVLLVDVTVS